MRTLTNSLRFGHISIARKFNFKRVTRFDDADKWAQQHKWENIKNYRQFISKTKENKKVFVTLSDKQDSQMQSIYNFQKRKYAWTNQLIFRPYRIDDHELELPIEGKTLLSFIKEGGFNFYKMSSQHQIFWLIFMSALVHIVLYFGWWHQSEDDTYVANLTLNPETVQTFMINDLEYSIKEFKRRMGIFLEELQNGQTV